MNRAQAGDPAVRTLEHELELVRTAVALVGSGGAPRVSLTGLRFGDELLEPARRMALEAGVRIVPTWTADDAGAGMVVEAMTDD